VTQPDVATPVEHRTSPSSRDPESLSAQLWQSAASTYELILAHPFLTELADGSLDYGCFAHYLVQDDHYIESYTQCLAMLAGRAPDHAAMATLVSHAAEAVALESTLHAELLEAMELAHLTREEIAPTPTTLAYADSLRASCAMDSFLEGLASVLPCYWIYAAVGHDLARIDSPDTVFAKWVENYSGGVYDKAVGEVLDLVDDLGRRAGPAQTARCVELYQRGARYEWMFWDAAYRRETWPI
jgi:thiaminase (transcriptional activator TenA)